MIELPLPNGTTLLSSALSRFDCGCAVLVGRLASTNEPSVALVPCALHHQEVDRARQRFIDMPPCSRPAIEIAVEILRSELDPA